MNIKRSYVAGTVTAALLLSGSAAFCCEKALADELDPLGDIVKITLDVAKPKVIKSSVTRDCDKVVITSEYSLPYYRLAKDGSNKNDMLYMYNVQAQKTDGTLTSVFFAQDKEDALEQEHSNFEIEHTHVVEPDSPEANTGLKDKELERQIIKVTLPASTFDDVSSFNTGEIKLVIESEVDSLAMPAQEITLPAALDTCGANIFTPLTKEQWAEQELSTRTKLFNAFISPDEGYQRLKREVEKLTPDNPLYSQYIAKTDKGEEAIPEIYTVNEKCGNPHSDIPIDAINALNMSSVERRMLNVVLYDLKRQNLNTVEAFELLYSVTQNADRIESDTEPTVTIDDAVWSDRSSYMYKLAAATLADKLAGTFDASDYKDKYVPDPWDNTAEYYEGKIPHKYSDPEAFLEGYNPEFVDSATAYARILFERGNSEDETIFAYRIQDPSRWAHESADGQSPHVFVYDKNGRGMELQRSSLDKYSAPKYGYSAYAPEGMVDGENYIWWIALPNQFLEDEGIVKVRVALNTKYSIYKETEPNSHLINFYAGAKSEAIASESDIWADMGNFPAFAKAPTFTRESVPHTTIFDYVLTSRASSPCDPEHKQSLAKVHLQNTKETLENSGWIDNPLVDCLAKFKTTDPEKFKEALNTASEDEKLVATWADQIIPTFTEFFERISNYINDLSFDTEREAKAYKEMQESPYGKLLGEAEKYQAALNHFLQKNSCELCDICLPKDKPSTPVMVDSDTQTTPDTQDQGIQVGAETHTQGTQAGVETHEVGVGDGEALLVDNEVQATPSVSDASTQATPDTKEVGVGDNTAHVANTGSQVAPETSTSEVQATPDTQDQGVGDSSAHVVDTGIQAKPETAESGITAKPDTSDNNVQIAPSVQDGEAQVTPDTKETASGDGVATTTDASLQTDAKATSEGATQTEAAEFADAETQTEKQSENSNTADKAVNTDLENKADTATQTDAIDTEDVATQTTPETGENKPIPDAEKATPNTEHGVDNALPKTGDATNISYLFLGILGGFFALIKRIKSRKA